MSRNKVIQSLSAVALGMHPLVISHINAGDLKTSSQPDNEAIENSQNIKRGSTSGISLSDSITAAVYANESNATYNITVSNNKKTWTNKEEKRYEKLTIKEALETISSEESKELNSLQKLRRNHLNPRSGEDIIFQYTLAKTDREMLNLLDRRIRLAPNGSHYKEAKTSSDI